MATDPEEVKMPRGKPRKPRARAPHGTPNGYWWHWRLGEEACPRCKKAWRENQRAYRLKRKRQKRMIRSILLEGANPRVNDERITPEVLKAIEGLITTHATPEEKKEIFRNERWDKD